MPSLAGLFFWMNRKIEDINKENKYKDKSPKELKNSLRKIKVKNQSKKLKKL